MAKLKSIEGSVVTKLLSGNMYFYRYSAETLTPFYDEYPLIFMIRKKGSLIEGINFHYMGVARRRALLNEMKPFFNTDVIESDTRLLVRRFRNLLLVTRKLRDAKIALHRYKINNIRSKIIMVEPENWEYAIREPTQKFITNSGNRQTQRNIWKRTNIQAKRTR
jgi:hypothetical protein